MKLLAAAALTLFASAAAPAATVYGVDTNNNLVTFDSALPGVTLSSVQINGLGSTLQAIDFRPLNGALYGLGANNTLYSISLSGAATAVGGPLALSGTRFGFDFNPTIDRIRVVGDTGQNYVLNPDTGAIQLVATPINGVAGASVTGNAYTSSFFGAPAASTQLYALDVANDLLATQNNNGGTLTPVGPFGRDIGPGASFDISGSDALVQDGADLYSISLASGALTSLGRTGSALLGIAIAPAVPEPATWGMMILGFGLVGSALRRRPGVRVRFAT